MSFTSCTIAKIITKLAWLAATYYYYIHINLLYVI
jgi:hypothetical protein